MIEISYGFNPWVVWSYLQLQSPFDPSLEDREVVAPQSGFPYETAKKEANPTSIHSSGRAMPENN